MVRTVGSDRQLLSTDLPLIAVVPLLDIAALLFAVTLSRGSNATALIFAVVATALLASARTRPTRLTLSLGEDLPSIVGRVAVAAVAVGLVERSLGAAEIVRIASIGIAMACIARSISYAIVRAGRARGVGAERALIVGAGTIGVGLADAMRIHKEHGLIAVGFVDTVDAERDLPLPVLGAVEDLGDLIALHGAQTVFVAFPNADDATLARALRSCDAMQAEIYAVPRLFELGVQTDHGPEELAGIPLARLRRSAHRSAAWPVKRALDILFAAVAVVVVSPLFGAIALAVRLTSSGPIFFRQRRIGENGRPIQILKFRSMRVNDDSDTTWNVARDGRLTPIGRLLRQSHLDELPQLLNVLRGDMSIVGPRPERPYFAELFSAEVPGYQSRHRVPVGMTGWAQVHGLNGDTSIEERVRYDNRYIERWSLWRDLVIMARTIPAILIGLRSDAKGGDGTAAAVEEPPAVVDLREVTIDLRMFEEAQAVGVEPDPDAPGVEAARHDARTNANGDSDGHANGNGNGHLPRDLSDGRGRP